MKTSYFLLRLAVVPAMAQTRLLTFGVESGIPTQTPLGETGDQMPFFLGPKMNVRILPRLSFETGVSYHWIGKRSDTGVFSFPDNNVLVGFTSGRGHAIEVPLLAKYYFVGEDRTWRPFVTAGPTIRRTSLDAASQFSVLSGSQLLNAVPKPSQTNQVKWNVDLAFGAGVDFRAGRFHLEPEARYSYWGAGKETAVRKNQLGLQLGFRF